MLYLLFVFISCFFCSFSAAVSHHLPSSAQCDVMINSICGIHFDTTTKCIVVLSCIMSCTKSEHTTWQAEVNIWDVVNIRYVPNPNLNKYRQSLCRYCSLRKIDDIFIHEDTFTIGSYMGNTQCIILFLTANINHCYFFMRQVNLFTSHLQYYSPAPKYYANAL